jgi:hypothetical protein
MIDLIRDGVPKTDLRERGGRAVYQALVSTACSACQRGWDQWEWQELVLEPRSELGRQAQTRDGWRIVPAARLRKTFDAAWEAATAWVSQRPPPFSRSEMSVEAANRAEKALMKVETAGNGLLDADRVVLAYAAELALQRGLDKVTMPWRDVRDRTGLGERTVKNSLRRLQDAGHLELVESGKPGPATRRAKVFRLPP